MLRYMCLACFTSVWRLRVAPFHNLVYHSTSSYGIAKELVEPIKIEKKKRKTKNNRKNRNPKLTSLRCFICRETWKQ